MAVSHEIPTPEQTRSTEEITQALDYAQRAVNQLRLDPSFHAVCTDANIDPVRGDDSADYWDMFREYVGQRVDAAKDKGEDRLRLHAVELVASTPVYLFNQLGLNITDHNRDRQEVLGAKRVTSYYNGLVRGFALEYPQTSVRAINLALLNTVSETIHDRALRQSSAQQINAAIRGAQHELAFGQILQQANISHRPANLEEDLKGTDFVVELGNKSLNVDVKASLAQINNRGSEGAFAPNGKNSIVIYSMTQDAEFRDRFFTDDSAAAAKAPVLVQQLVKAQKQVA